MVDHKQQLGGLGFPLLHRHEGKGSPYKRPLQHIQRLRPSLPGGVRPPAGGAFRGEVSQIQHLKRRFDPRQHPLNKQHAPGGVRPLFKNSAQCRIRVYRRPERGNNAVSVDPTPQTEHERQIVQPVDRLNHFVHVDTLLRARSRVQAGSTLQLRRLTEGRQFVTLLPRTQTGYISGKRRK